MADIKLDRISFASIKKPFDYPDFLDIQLKSFRDFFQLETNPDNRKNEGLFKVFAENFPITDARNNFVLEFLDYYIDAPQYTIAEWQAKTRVNLVTQNHSECPVIFSKLSSVLWKIRPFMFTIGEDAALFTLLVCIYCR